MTKQQSGAALASRVDGRHNSFGHLALYRLIWRSPTFQMAALFAIAIAILAATLRDMGLAMMPMVLIMLLRFMNQRATPFEAALPVRPREVVLARMLSIIALIWLPLVTWILASGSSHSLPGLREIPASMKLAILGLTTLAVIVPNLIAMGRMQVPLLSAVILPSSALAIVGVLAMQIFSAPEVLIVLGAAIFTSCWFLWTRMPQSFLLVDTAPVAAADTKTTLLWDGITAPSDRTDALNHADKAVIPASAGTQRLASTALGSSVRGHDGNAGRAASQLASWRPILRSAVTPVTWLALGAAIILGINPNNWLMNVGLWTLMPVALLKPRLRWLFGVPLSHRQFTLINVLPAVLPVLLGFAIGMAGPLHLKPHSMFYGRPDSDASEARFQYRTRVPLDYWLIAPDGEAPLINAPWGEVSASDTLSVFGVLLYNPYAAEKTSSPRFVEWQFERATQSVYGQPISYAAYDSGNVVLPGRLHDTPAVFVLGVGLVIAFTLFVVFLMEFPRWHLLSRRRWLKNSASALIGIPLFGLMYVEFSHQMKYHVDIVIPLFKVATYSLTEHLPGGLFVAALLAALPVIAMYSVVELQFSKSEFADRAKPKHTWWT